MSVGVGVGEGLCERGRAWAGVGGAPLVLSKSAKRSLSTLRITAWFSTKNGLYSLSGVLSARTHPKHKSRVRVVRAVDGTRAPRWRSRTDDLRQHLGSLGRHLLVEELFELLALGRRHRVSRVDGRRGESKDKPDKRGGRAAREAHDTRARPTGGRCAMRCDEKQRAREPESQRARECEWAAKRWWWSCSSAALRRPPLVVASCCCLSLLGSCCCSCRAVTSCCCCTFFNSYRGLVSDHSSSVLRPDLSPLSSRPIMIIPVRCFTCGKVCTVHTCSLAHTHTHTHTTPCYCLGAPHGGATIGGHASGLFGGVGG